MRPVNFNFEGVADDHRISLFPVQGVLKKPSIHKKMPANDENVDEPPQILYNQSNDFITCRHDRSLQPLSARDISLSEFSAELDSYLSVLKGGGSIAFGRGEDLASIRLSKCLENLFLTPTPTVTEGPPLTWTQIVLFAGPHFEGPSKLKIGESLVELPETDFELLSSGRPWRFLYPWPDKGDCKKELRSSEMALQELDDTRQKILEVLENMSVVTQRLTNHHDIVAQLFRDQPHTAPQEEALEIGGVRTNPPDEAAPDSRASNVRISREDTLSDQDPPPTRGDIHYSNSDQATLPIIKELHEKGQAGASVSGNNRQHENPETPSQGSRLHLSDFIQSLSDILDDPRNTETLRWSEDERSIILAQANKFPAHLLAKLSTKSYHSLVRRLYYYGFRKIGGAYRHDLFIRGQPSSILPARQMSQSPSLPSPMHNSIPRSGPRYKVIKKRRARQSV
ncbi:hypothetical protein PMG11_11222 [Penicillium brasilianum]|uniref:HSF-type DNA-binding domain-containing protein n=1 Tax=Penicillium brasilianum TaxID=104259 RepID=A0A0F7U3A2_PENBI|nr:hypothetical protein PMG11_11222 [Penicillium brasilianum]